MAAGGALVASPSVAEVSCASLGPTPKCCDVVVLATACGACGGRWWWAGIAVVVLGYCWIATGATVAGWSDDGAATAAGAAGSSCREERAASC